MDRQFRASPFHERSVPAAMIAMAVRIDDKLHRMPFQGLFERARPLSGVNNNRFALFRLVAFGMIFFGAANPILQPSSGLS